MGTILNQEDYILYILNNLEPTKSDKFYVNKLAFLIEFAYLFSQKGEKQLSNLNYAALPYGPCINDYADLFASMQQKGLISINKNSLRVLTDKRIEVPEEVSVIALPLIKKYSGLTFNELSAITHQTDSYKITSKNGTVIGNTINKSLAELESFYGYEVDEQTQFSEAQLPKVDRTKLVKYEFGPGV